MNSSDSQFGVHVVCNSCCCLTCCCNCSIGDNLRGDDIIKLGVRSNDDSDDEDLLDNSEFISNSFILIGDVSTCDDFLKVSVSI